MDYNNIYCWRTTLKNKTVQEQRAEIKKELELEEGKRKRYKKREYTPKHIALILFDIRENKRLDIYDLETGYTGNKILLRILREQADKEKRNVKNLIKEYDTIKIVRNESKIIEKWEE